ncbi:MAG: hypothetical protein ACK4MV_05765 [Beijerinckiaceae bacterium]
MQLSDMPHPDEFKSWADLDLWNGSKYADFPQSPSEMRTWLDHLFGTNQDLNDLRSLLCNGMTIDTALERIWIERRASLRADDSGSEELEDFDDEDDGSDDEFSEDQEGQEFLEWSLELQELHRLLVAFEAHGLNVEKVFEDAVTFFAKKSSEQYLSFVSFRDEAFVNVGPWFQRKKISAAEAVALSFSRNPKTVNVASMFDEAIEHGSIFALTYLERAKALKKDIDCGVLTDPMSVSDFRAWLMTRSDGQMFTQVPSVDAKPLNHLERIFLQDALLMFALVYHELDPNYKPKTGTDKLRDIVALMNGLTFSGTDKTLRKHIVEAIGRAKTKLHFEQLVRRLPAVITAEYERIRTRAEARSTHAPNVEDVHEKKPSVSPNRLDDRP